VALGFGAGQTAQPDHSIVINASGESVNGATAGGFFVVPVRENIGDGDHLSPLFYDAKTGEITYQKAAAKASTSIIIETITADENQPNQKNQDASSPPQQSQQSQKTDEDIGAAAILLEQLTQQMEELRRENAVLRDHFTNTTTQLMQVSQSVFNKQHTYIVVTSKPKSLMSLNYYDVNSVRGSVAVAEQAYSLPFSISR
jgi:hypothetical protein